MHLPFLAWRCSASAANAATSLNPSRLLRKNIQRRKQIPVLPSSRLLHLVHLQRAANYHATHTSPVSPDTHSSAWLTQQEESGHSKKAKLPEEDDDEWAVNSSVRSSRSSGADSANAKGETLETASENFSHDNMGKQASVEGTPTLNATLPPSESNATSGSDYNSHATANVAETHSPIISKNDSALFPSKSAAGLDLSSSILIQQMLFSKNEPVETSTPPALQEETPSLPVDRNTENLKATTSRQPSTIPKESDEASAIPLCTEIPSLNASESRVISNIPNELAATNTASEMMTASESDLSHKLDIRVGKILSVENHINANSLYVEQVDVGDGMECTTEDLPIPTTRTIVSGLVKYFDRDGLKDRNVVVVRNMKPTKLRGVVSEGMLLCAEHEGKVELLEPPAGSLPGERVYFEGLENADANSLPSLLNPKRKIFETVAQDFSTNNLGVALYKGKFPFRTRHGLVTVKTIREGGKIR